MSIFAVIKADHKKIGEVLNKLEKTTEAQPEKRARLFEQLKETLTSHSKSEEQAVYSALKEHEKTRPIGFEGCEEHQIMNDLLEGLSNLSPSKETWTAKLTTLKEIVEHHVDEEEEMFKKMKKVFNQDELKEMAISMKELEKAYSISPDSRPENRPENRIDSMGAEEHVH